MCMHVCVCVCVCVCGGVVKKCLTTEQKVLGSSPTMHVCVHNHVETSVCVLPLVVMACCVQSVIVLELVAPCELHTIL